MKNDKSIKQILSRIDRLEKAAFGKIRTDNQEKNATDLSTKINFSLNERAFVKRNAVKKSGSEKFTLMVAYLTKGKVGETVSLGTIQEHWNKMKSLLGEFNRFHSNEAKTRGWVDTEGRGIYKLTDEWEQVL
jgi:hypothetical protein